VSSYTAPGVKTRGPGAVAETAYHEYGHAVDLHLGGGGGFRSDRNDFRETFNRELGKSGPVQFWGTPQHEGFAELFKVASGGKSRYGNLTIQRHFPGSLAKVKEIVTSSSGGP
jgi:hypothetical protein